MKQVNFGKNFTTTLGGFFQYDYGQIIDVYGIGTDIDDLRFEFIQDGQQITVLSDYIPETESYQVRIPDTFLQRASDIVAYIYYSDVEMGQTLKILIIKVSHREKFNDLPDPEYEDVITQILERLAEMQEEIDNWTISEEQLQAIVDEVEASIDLNDYYDKTEVDTLLAGKASTATVQENTEDIADLELAMASKVDSSELNNYYTKTQVDNLIPDVSGLATKTEVSDGLALKADKSDTYTKQEVNNLIPDVSGFATTTQLNDGLALKANASDVYTKSDTYSKSEVYNKTEIDATLGNIQTLLEAI